MPLPLKNTDVLVFDDQYGFSMFDLDIVRVSNISKHIQQLRIIPAPHARARFHVPYWFDTSR